MHTPAVQRRRSAIRPWVLGWILATLAFSALHYGVWNPPLYHGSAVRVPGESTLKLADNVIQLTILPAWAFAWRVLGRFQDLPTTMFANALGWGIWTVVLYSMVRALHRLASSGVARVSEPAQNVADPARRRFITGMASGLAGGIPAGTLAQGTLVNPWSLEVARYEVPIHGLPDSMRGLRLVQISDTHLGPRIPRDHIRRAVELTRRLLPDLVLLTGDYIHMGSWYIRPAAELFEPLVSASTPRLGVVAVMGNHDHYGDARQMTNELARIGVRVLNNDRTFVSWDASGLTDDAAAGGLCIAGVDDLLEGEVDHDAALAGVLSHTPRIMLAHNPDTSELLAGLPVAPRVDLMISGHTHGGQIAIPGYGPPVVPSRYGRRFARGLVQTSLCPMVVSAGVGMSIMPVRIGVPPEIVEITLVPQ
ncbi:MAG: 3',5'-cyclic adenosine monophosphate phosphodiesterase CpdA [Phycisphaerales bacterium]|nr:3',5'-cyclic adenosine monophosphate phosphodiesterase CpdA [Phycisphaerales bacterium]